MALQKTGLKQLWDNFFSPNEWGYRAQSYPSYSSKESIYGCVFKLKYE